MGLLVIIIILMLLNVVSNYIIYKARFANIEKESVTFSNAGLALSRNLEGRLPGQLHREYIEQTVNKYHLKDIVIIPSLPVDDLELSKRNWFQGVIGQISPGQLNYVAGKILEGEYRTVNRGEGSEFYYLYPFKSKTGRALLILSTDNGELAFLEDASNFIFYISILVVLGIIVVYSWLYKSILAPFRKIKDEAISAGRIFENHDEVETAIEEYHRIIEELKDKEAELLVLNDAITRKADSLESYNQYLLSSMNSGLISLDNQGRILSINDAAETMLSISEAGVKNSAISELSFVTDELLNDINEAIRSRQSLNYREYELLDNHRTKFVGVGISIVKSEATENLGVSILINDITELKQLRQELERSNRLAALGEMAAGLAHQIRNSLGAVLGYGTLLKKKLSKNELDTSSAESLMAETRDAELLISKFLNITKPLEYHPEPVLFKKLLDELHTSWKIQENCQQIKFSFDLHDDFEIQLDPLLIKQVLNNLINNSAVAYGDQSGEINISGKFESEHFILSITDSAGGIAPDIREKIFTPFFSTRADGTGLGLPLVKKIIEIHNGLIRVEPNGADGTTFVISLPLGFKSESVPAIKIQN